MKNTRKLILCTLSALLLVGCADTTPAATDAGDRPTRATTAAITPVLSDTATTTAVTTDQQYTTLFPLDENGRPILPEVIWGSPHLTDEAVRGYGEVYWVDNLNPQVEQYDIFYPHQLFAVFVEIAADSDKSCEDYFAGLGWKILPIKECQNRPYLTTTHTLLVEVTHQQLWAITIEDVAAYFECPPEEIMVSFFHAVKAN